jgi:hypothetical protein
MRIGPSAVSILGIRSNGNEHTRRNVMFWSHVIEILFQNTFPKIVIQLMSRRAIITINVILQFIHEDQVVVN